MSADKPTSNKVENPVDASASDKLRAEASTEPRAASTVPTRADSEQRTDAAKPEKAMAKPEAMPADVFAPPVLSRRNEADLRILRDSWKGLVTDNDKLSVKQKDDLTDALKNLENTPEKIADFRKLVNELGRLGGNSGTDVQARVDAIAKIANTMVQYPHAVNISADRIIEAKSVAALTQVAESFAQAAPFEENAPLAHDGKPSTTGDGYEHAAGRALQEALRNKVVVDKMIEAGKLPPGDWVFVPAAKGSVADDLKMDGMLVDLKNGKAVFLDFAMHQNGDKPYGALAKKLEERYQDGSVKRLWGMTLDNDSIGWNPQTGESSGAIKTAQILERLGSYMKGTQAQDLGLKDDKGNPLRQNAPFQYDIATLKKDLGGHFPNFGPVNSNLEAQLMSEPAGPQVKTRLAELRDIQTQLNSARPEMRVLGKSAEAASSAADDVNRAVNFVNQGLRAAVEAERTGARERVYGNGKIVPDVNITMGADYAVKEQPGKPFISIMGDDNFGADGKSRAATELRIYQNGDVFVEPGVNGFKKLGNIRELGKTVAEELQKNGIDPQQFREQITALSRIGRQFDTISNDLKAVKSKDMSAEKFWQAHPELRLLADGIGNAKASERAAQEARTLQEARTQLDRSAKLAELPDAEKNAIAEKAIQLEKAGLKQSSYENVRSIMQLESLGMKTADAIEVTSFGAAMGKSAESWSASELKSNFESAKSLQATEHQNVKDLADVFRIGQLQNELKVDATTARALFKIKGLMPDAANGDLLSVKQMYDSLRTSIKSLSYEDAVSIFRAGHGMPTQPVIDEMGKLKALLKDGLKVEELASLASRNVQVELRYGVDKSKADAIRAAIPEILKSGVPLENAHDTVALMQTRSMSQADALQLAKMMPELRGSQNFASFEQLTNTAKILQASAAVSPESVRAEYRDLLAEGLSKHGNDMKALRQYLEEHLFEKGTAGGANEKDWAKVFDAVSRAQSEQEFARAIGLPDADAERRAALDGYKKLFGAAENKSSESRAEQQAGTALESQLRGTPTFDRLTDQQRMTDALKQLADRALQRMPESNAEKSEFLTKQLKGALRKQLGLATDAELPEAVRNMQVRVVDGDGAAPRMSNAGGAAVMEVPAKLLERNPKSVLVDAYAHASGLGMLDLLHEKGNTAVTFRSLEPMLSKIASQAEKIVGARSLAIAARDKPVLTAEAAASDRRISLDPQKPIVTAWDGENLSFAGEKFHVQTEIEKVQRERETRVNDLEDKYKQAKELAERTKNGEDVARAQALEAQLSTERQNLRAVSELRQAMSGQRGQSAQDKARNLVKAAADRAIEERLKGRERGGAPVSRAAAMAMVVSSLAFMYIGANRPAQADTYSGSFH